MTFNGIQIFQECILNELDFFPKIVLTNWKSIVIFIPTVGN